MAKNTHLYTCQQCGTQASKWAGRCDDCGAWNSFIEESVVAFGRAHKSKDRISALPLTTLTGEEAVPPRYLTHIQEFDRTCGGGLVPGSVILVGGDPGIGKSTLLLQICATLSTNHECIYISGEEGVEQIRLRAQRLKVQSTPINLATGTQIEQILPLFKGSNPSQLFIIDSIQTMFTSALDAAPGTVTQVRACAHELITAAKRTGAILVLVGHVTKEGMLAGPRVLEHMVDTVLYFEGERGQHFRLLRSVKNRFGPAGEVGVFEMTERGLEEVLNPSSLFLAERSSSISGIAVFPGIEGTRPMLVEIESLVAPSPLGTPRRTVVGWDAGRLAMITAVLEARCGVNFAGKDIYLNVTGGLKISEPAADLAVAAALISSVYDAPLPLDAVFFGEVGLSGEIRPVQQSDTRLKEAKKLGFRGAYVPLAKNTQPILDIAPIEFLGKLVQTLRRSAMTKAAKEG